MNAEPLRERWSTLRFELLRRLGWPGLLGLSLLAGSLALASMIPGLQASTEELRAATRQARLAQPRSRAAANPALSDAQALEALPGLFPSLAQSGSDIALILAQARKSHLILGSAQYQLIAAEPNARFTRYQVLLPIKDQYSTIRRFLATVLNSMPHTALQEIHVERPSVDGSLLEARVRFELIYRGPASDGAPPPRLKLVALRTAVSPDGAGNPFQVLSWLPPAPPPPHPQTAAAPPPPPPSAPPLPFAFVGVLDGAADKPRVFLSRDDRLLIVSPGDVIDEQYRVEAIAATDVVLTYLPLDQKQILSTQSEGN